MPIKKYDWLIQENLFVQTNQDSTISQKWENSKLFNITPKYFSCFNNAPRAT